MPDHVRSSRWWRFEACTITDNVLRPAPGALLQPYDPWERFNDVKGKYRTVQTLWGEFAEMVRHLRADALARYLPSEEGTSQILEWSNQYGLLGVLPSSVQMIVLPPICEGADEGEAPQNLTSDCFIQQRHVRVAGMWISHSDVASTSSEEVSRSAVPDKVTKPVWPQHFERPRSLAWEWENLSIKTDEGNAWLSGFFSKTPPEYQYPQPLSTEFWASYQEPVWAWMRAAIVFAESVEIVSQYAIDRFVGTEWPLERVQNANQALWVLNSLAAAETPFYEFGPSTVQSHLACGSLLSAMAQMFFQDLLDGRRARRCLTCKKIFVSNDDRATYCSVKCRNTASVRRHRKHKN